MKRVASVRHFSFRFEHPAREEPAWKGIIERWYQLDAAAYGLAQAYTAWKPWLPLPPSMILLASAEASNETDHHFARTGAASPAKFVHTLPNVRCSSLCQVMEWAGPVLCFQRDPFTQSHALREGVAFLEAGTATSVWIASVRRIGERIPSYRSDLIVLSNGSEPGQRATMEIFHSGAKSPLQSDRELQEWLDSGAGVFPLPGDFELRKGTVL